MPPKEQMPNPKGAGMQPSPKEGQKPPMGGKMPSPKGNLEKMGKPSMDVPDMGMSKEKKKPETKPVGTQDDMFKFEMKYMNGGFNNGVKIKPDKDGKALVEISIYGGGEKKNMSVGPLPESIRKLIKAYEIQATKGEDSEEITGELKEYFKKLSDNLSIEAISILQEADQKMLNAIKKVFKMSK